MNELSISLRQMLNDKWHWQASDSKATSGMIGPGPDMYPIGGGIYDPKAIDYDTAEAACAAAMEWWTKTGLPHSQHLQARIVERRRQIKAYGKWSHEGMDQYEASR